MGFRRSLRYIFHRLMRIKDSTHKIALGLTLGFAVSFTPIPGTHILQAAILAWLLRGNVVASFIGTLFGNPLTLPLMWWLAFKVGDSAFQFFGFPVSPMPSNFHFSLAEITSDFLGLFLPWVLGGYVLMGLSLLPFYTAFYWIVRQARCAQVRWKQERMHRIARSLTEPQA